MSKGLDDSAELDQGARFHGFNGALKPWAILHHHPLGTGIAQGCPCLIVEITLIELGIPETQSSFECGRKNVLEPHCGRRPRRKFDHEAEPRVCTSRLSILRSDHARIVDRSTSCSVSASDSHSDACGPLFVRR